MVGFDSSNHIIAVGGDFLAIAILSGDEAEANMSSSQPERVSAG